jgi:hypothetical protein
MSKAFHSPVFLFSRILKVTSIVGLFELTNYNFIATIFLFLTDFSGSKITC